MSTTQSSVGLARSTTSCRRRLWNCPLGKASPPRPCRSSCVTVEFFTHCRRFPGEMITLVRKIDENWFEGRIGDRTGIIPASYCQVLSLPQVKIPSRLEKAASSKPVAAPAAHSLIHNGSSVPSKHYYTPYYGGRNSPGRSATPAVREAHAAIDQLIDEALFHLEEDLDRRRTPKPLNLRVNPRPEPAL